jgi:hypothetical protein
MQSNNFLETALRIIRENPEVFEALVEFEKTKKLPKTSYRRRINITIDADLLRKIRQYCNSRGVAMSRLIEKQLREELKNAG